MNVFDRKITVWRNTYRTANNKCEVPLMQFLKAGIDYLPTIMYLRQLYDYMVQSYSLNPAASATAEEQYREGKKNLPLATIGGTFANGGLREDLSEATNLLCLDIDATKPKKAAQLKAEGKEVPNEWVNDWEALKWKLSKLPFVAYCALSVGGHGIYLIIPIEDYHHHAEAWESLQHLFSKHLHLTIDAATKDITRPRFISYDSQPYINEDAEVFKIQLPEKRTTMPFRRYSSSPSSSTEEAVRKCVDAIERERLDITSDYSQWIDIASALFNEFGEAGKQYFERISRFYPNAHKREINSKWKQNKNRSKVGIGTFFEICSRHGIRFRESPSESPLTKANRHSPPKSEETTIIYKRTPLFPEAESIWADLTESEFNSILSPDAVAQWQAAHQTVPF